MNLMIPSQPIITNVIFDGNNLIISGTNGVPNENFYLLSATNLTLPLIDWTILGTNQFDSAGNFSLTNSISKSSSQFFRLDGALDFFINIH